MTMVTTNIVQEDFRVRNGDTVGLNADSDWKGALNANVSMDVDTTFRVRFQIAETNDVNWVTAFDLNFSINGGSYSEVGAISASGVAVRFVATGQYTDGDATTDVLSGGTGTFDAGEGRESNPSSTPLLKSEHSEYEYCIEIVGSEVSDSDVIRLRMGGDGATDNFNAYDNTPAITAVASGTTHAGAASLSGSATLAAASAVLHPGAASLSASAAVTADSAVEHSGAASLSCSASVAASAVATFVGAASIFPSGVLAASAIATLVGAASITPSATLAAAGTVASGGVTHDASAHLYLFATLAAAGSSKDTHEASASLIATATLAALGDSDREYAATYLNLTATVIPSGSVTRSAAAAMSAGATLAATGAVNTAFGQAGIVCTATLAAAGSVDVREAATLYARAIVRAAGSCIVTSSAAMSAAASLAAVPTRTTSALWLDYGRILEIATDKYGDVQFHFEATMRTSDSDLGALCRLWNITDGQAVDGSEIETAQESATRVRSGVLALSGTKEYKAQIGTRPGCVVTASGAGVVVQSPT